MINLKDEIKFPCGLSHSKKIFVSSFFLFIMSIYGGINLGVENSFVNYFKKNTEIYKGMKLIDDKLGGTTPLSVIVKFPKKSQTADEDDEFDSWDDEDQVR